GQRALEEDEKRMKELNARIKQLKAKLDAPGEQYKLEQLSSEAVAVMQATIRRALTDPDSAKFGELRSGRDAKGLLHVCGWVNAKNSFGGYNWHAAVHGLRYGTPVRRPRVVAALENWALACRQAVLGLNKVQPVALVADHVRGRA